jgi:hypothetical protein
MLCLERERSIWMCGSTLVQSLEFLLVHDPTNTECVKVNDDFLASLSVCAKKNASALLHLLSRIDISHNDTIITGLEGIFVLCVGPFDNTRWKAVRFLFEAVEAASADIDTPEALVSQPNAYYWDLSDRIYSQLFDMHFWVPKLGTQYSDITFPTAFVPLTSPDMSLLLKLSTAVSHAIHDRRQKLLSVPHSSHLPAHSPHHRTEELTDQLVMPCGGDVSKMWGRHYHTVAFPAESLYLSTPFTSTPTADSPAILHLSEASSVEACDSAALHATVGLQSSGLWIDLVIARDLSKFAIADEERLGRLLDEISSAMAHLSPTTALGRDKGKRATRETPHTCSEPDGHNIGDGRDDGGGGRYFVKLCTRSPKDSQLLQARADLVSSHAISAGK